MTSLMMSQGCVDMFLLLRDTSLLITLRSHFRFTGVTNKWPWLRGEIFHYEADYSTQKDYLEKTR